MERNMHKLKSHIRKECILQTVRIDEWRCAKISPIPTVLTIAKFLFNGMKIIIQNRSKTKTAYN